MPVNIGNIEVPDDRDAKFSQKFGEFYERENGWPKQECTFHPNSLTVR